MSGRIKGLQGELSEQKRAKPGPGVCGGRLPPSGGQAGRLIEKSLCLGLSVLCRLPLSSSGQIASLL